jgi:hypothetical protein
LQDLAATKQCLINELDDFRHKLEAMQEENVHLTEECERLSHAALQPESRSVNAGDSDGDASGVEWRILKDQKLRLQLSASHAPCSEDNVFVADDDVAHLRLRIEELERENRALYTMHRLVHRSPGDASVGSSDQDSIEAGYIDEKLRSEMSMSGFASKHDVPLEVLISDTSPRLSQRFDLFIHEDRDSEASPSPTCIDASFSGAGSAEYDRLRADYEAYRSKAKKNYAKLKARLVATVREFSEYKASVPMVNSPAPLRSVASPTIPDLYMLQSENAALRSKIEELSSSLKTQRLLSETPPRIEQEMQTTVVCGVVATDDDQRDVVIQTTASDHSGMESELSRSGGDCAERLAAVELELAVVRSECAVLKQQNSSLEQLVVRFKLAADKRERPEDESTVTVSSDGAPVTTHTSDAAAAEARTVPTGDGADERRNLVVENRRLRQERKAERESHAKKLQALEDRCTKQQVQLHELLQLVKPPEDASPGNSAVCQRCAELTEKCRELESRAAKLELLQRVTQSDQQTSTDDQQVSLSANVESLVSGVHLSSADTGQDCLLSCELTDAIDCCIAVQNANVDLHENNVVTSPGVTACSGTSSTNQSSNILACNSVDDVCDAEIKSIFEQKGVTDQFSDNAVGFTASNAKTPLAQECQSDYLSPVLSVNNVLSNDSGIVNFVKDFEASATVVQPVKHNNSAGDDNSAAAVTGHVISLETSLTCQSVDKTRTSSQFSNSHQSLPHCLTTNNMTPVDPATVGFQNFVVTYDGNWSSFTACGYRPSDSLLEPVTDFADATPDVPLSSSPGRNDDSSLYYDCNDAPAHLATLEPLTSGSTSHICQPPVSGDASEASTDGASLLPGDELLNDDTRAELMSSCLQPQPSSGASAVLSKPVGSHFAVSAAGKKPGPVNKPSREKSDSGRRQTKPIKTVAGGESVVSSKGKSGCRKTEAKQVPCVQRDTTLR